MFSTLRVAALSVLMAGAVFAQDGRDSEITDIIQNQIDAFKANDFDAAFGFASPMIQGMFGTPENFGAMVRTGYPMVWKPSGVRFLDLKDANGEFHQKVMVTDESGAIHFLDYEMIRSDDDGDWQINGVQLLNGQVGA